MIDLNLIKKKQLFTNRFHPELATFTTWESSNLRIEEEFFGGIGEKRKYKVFIGGEKEDIGYFFSDSSKSMKNQIKEVILEAFPNETFIYNGAEC